MANDTFIIDVNINGAQNGLIYRGSNTGKKVGKIKSDNRNAQLLRNYDLQFRSSDGDIVVHFKTPGVAPFKGLRSSETVTRAAKKSKLTDALTAKDYSDSVFANYTVVLFPDQNTYPAAPDSIIDDPELEAGGDNLNIQVD